MNSNPRCSVCGYTEEDAKFHMDHHLCKNAGNAPWEKKADVPMTDEQRVKAEHSGAVWVPQYGAVYDVNGGGRLSGYEWWTFEADAWADAARRIRGMAAPPKARASDEGGECKGHSGAGPKHKWIGRQVGGSPVNAESYEWVRYCNVCGVEDTCEGPISPCLGIGSQNTRDRPDLDYTKPVAEPAPQTFEEWMLPAAQEINRAQLSRDHIIKDSFGLKHPIMSVDEQVAIMRKHWNAAKASSPVVAGGESAPAYVDAFNEGVEAAAVAFEYMWQDWIGAAAYMRKQKKPLIKDVRGKE